MPTPLGPDTCAMCPKMCRFTCPAARAARSDSVHPTGLAATARSARHGNLSWEQAAETLYACTMCLGCNSVCALDQDVPDWLAGARAEAVAAGAAPGSVLALRASLGPVTVAAQPSGSRDVVYVASCQAGPSPDVIRVCRPAAVVSGCCGALLHDLGFPEDAVTMRTEVLAAAGGRRVVCDSDSCAVWLEATPFALFAYGLWERGELAASGALGTVAYHDPCLLARRLGVTEEPRRLVEALGGEVLEPYHTRAQTRCCGAGAGFGDTHPGLADAAAQERVYELAATGADAFVTASARCAAALKAAGLGVVDLAEAL